MDKLLRDLPYFVEVARQKSFTQAADALDVPISTLSRRIAALEKELGVSLFRRNTRRVDLTESGSSFFESCTLIMSEVENARDNLLRDQKSPSGPVRLSVPSDIFHGFMTGALSEFALQYPDIRMEISFTNRWVDLMTEPYDLDIRTGDLPDSNLRVRKLFSVNLGVYAAPKLLEFYPEPKEPEDLQKVPCLDMHRLSGGWTLSNGSESRKIPLNFVHYLNGASLVAEFLVSGLGVALVPPRMMAPFEKHGLVKRILPEWSELNSEINLVMPSGELPYRVRLFVDYLAEVFANDRTFDLEPLILAGMTAKSRS